MTEPTTPPEWHTPDAVGHQGSGAPAEPQHAPDPQNAAQAHEREQTQGVAEGQPAAARTDPNEPNTDPFGMSLQGRTEIGGGAITKELKPDVPVDTTIDARYFHLRYNASRLAKEAGHLIARSAENIGLWGKGHTYRGNGGILVNVDTLEKVRVQDGYRFEGDEVFANSRDLPPALVEGDIAKNLSGETAREMMAKRDEAQAAAKA